MEFSIYSLTSGLPDWTSYVQNGSMKLLQYRFCSNVSHFLARNQNLRYKTVTLMSKKKKINK